MLKRVLPNTGLANFAKTDHTVNIEKPDDFKSLTLELRHVTLAEAGKWTPGNPMAAGTSLI